MAPPIRGIQADAAAPRKSQPPTPTEVWSYPATGDLGEIARLLQDSMVSASCKHLPWYVASVAPQARDRLWQILRDHWPETKWIDVSSTDSLYPVLVDHPQRVGVDRVMAGVGAYHRSLAEGQCSGSPQTGGSQIHEPPLGVVAASGVIVVDAGTAITVDLIGADGSFLGGAILPGFAMQLASLSRGTSQLPSVSLGDDSELPSPSLYSDQNHPESSISPFSLCRAKEAMMATASFPLPAKNTVSAIRSGVFWGTIGAMAELVRRTVEAASALDMSYPKVFVTGGASKLIHEHLPFDCDWQPDLVLEGICYTAQHLRQRSTESDRSD